MRGLYESFFGSSQDDDESDDEYDFSTDRSVQMYTWGDHRVQTETDTDSLRADADRLAGVDDARADLLREAADEYEQMQREPVKFECPTCHLGHSHSASKHALTGDLDVRRAFVAGMKYEDNCHCGVNELAMLLDFAEHLPTRIFTDVANEDISEERIERVRAAAGKAPIGNHVREDIDQRRDALEADFESDGDGDDAEEPTIEDDDSDGDETFYAVYGGGILVDVYDSKQHAQNHERAEFKRGSKMEVVEVTSEDPPTRIHDVDDRDADRGRVDDDDDDDDFTVGDPYGGR